MNYMLSFRKGDILEEYTGLIIHGCNASGGFGSGLAGQIKDKYPQVYKEFKKIPVGKSSLGHLQIVHAATNLYIGNAVTQLGYGYDGGRYADTGAIFEVLSLAAKSEIGRKMGILTVRIGCGLGGLSWESEVLPIFQLVVDIYNTPITVFSP